MLALTACQLKLTVHLLVALATTHRNRTYCTIRCRPALSWEQQVALSRCRPALPWEHQVALSLCLIVVSHHRFLWVSSASKADSPSEQVALVRLCMTTCYGACGKPALALTWVGAHMWTQVVSAEPCLRALPPLNNIVTGASARLLRIGLGVEGLGCLKASGIHGAWLLSIVRNAL